MDTGGFPIDLVLFGMVAAFLVLRLRSILGRRTGYERPAQPQAVDRRAASEPATIIEGQVVPPPPAGARATPEPASAAGEAMARMAAVDRGFDAGRFLAGAETAFRMIVTAFAAGDRATLRPLLSDDTMRAFDAAITAREAAGQTQRTEIRAIEQAGIETAELRDTRATVTVRFVSDQTNLTTAADGSVAAGTDAVTEITDLWTFERDLTSPDPTWRLIAARSA